MQPYPPTGAASRFSGQEFVKGFVMTACLAALQDSPPLRRKATVRRVLRRALQGGTALGAAQSAARAAVHGDYSRALLSASLGAAGVYLIERLLRDEAGPARTKEQING